MSDAYLHEAWCPRCHVSHPPGTRRCLHCGGGVLPTRPGESLRGASATGSPAPMNVASAPVDATDDEPAAAPAKLSPLKLGINVIWVALFVVVTVMRVCSERG